jgi:hypothetical protein
MSYKKVANFKPADKPKADKIYFINFGSDGESFILHIDNWDTYEMPALKEEWRNTIFIFDVENRGIRINSQNLQSQLKKYWGKKASLVIQRWIMKDKKGNFIYSTTEYKVTQLNPKSLWDYEDLESK